MRPTVNFSRQAVNVFFHILTRCNLACGHCYINPAQHGTKTLSLGTIEKWLSAFVRRDRQPDLIFLGGEPTLHPELSAAVISARQMGYGSITVDTNGYLFNDIIEKVTPEEVDFFSFSLDGASKATNDRIRGKGSFDVCIKGIGKAISKGFNASLIYTASRENIDDLENMVPLVSRLGIRRFFIQVIGRRGKMAARGKRDVQVGRDQWLSITAAVAEKIAEAGIPVSYPKVYLDPSETFECAGRVAENYFIFPNGRVYRCPLCEDYPWHSLAFEGGKLTRVNIINEADLFELDIPEGCVMNKIVQPGNLSYNKDGTPAHKIACCLLKEDIQPSLNSQALF
jgi:MoaA/NifB/PqqE/SkfB family radical SAM enzyme